MAGKRKPDTSTTKATPADTGHSGTLGPLVSRAAGSGHGLDGLLRAEWVLANGLGGFAMGTAAGVPTRRYHAYLIAATSPPVGRVLAWAATADWLVLLPGAAGGVEQRIDLSTFRFSGRSGGVMSPKGTDLLQRFERDPAGVVRWEYTFGPVRVVKELVLAHGANAAVLKWRIRTGGHAARLEIRPLIALRDFHGPLIHHAEHTPPAITAHERRFEASRDGVTLGLDAVSGLFKHDPQWWYNFEYVRDAERGQDCHEDLFNPGSFEVTLPSVPMLSGSDMEHVAEISAWVEAPGGLGAGKGGRVFGLSFNAIAKANADRLKRLAASVQTSLPDAVAQPERERLGSLVAASDLFVVAREPRPDAPALAPGVSIIAGYPWFSDWGRDSMIALPGLLLATRRFDEARAVLLAFATHLKDGLIPNCFDNRTGQPEYNTADASLWFLHAAPQLAAAAADPDIIRGDILDACSSIIHAYRAGTHFGIAVDDDGLIRAGDDSTQLTWMDAKRDGVVFTPRHGKPVELSALWYSGLLEVAQAREIDDPADAAQLRAWAEHAGESFRAKFWDPARSCLFDTLTPVHGRESPSPEFRPNQIFAISQPFSPLDDDRARAVLHAVRDRLLTPMGLRTLDAKDPKFAPRYRGALTDRDRAYHNGTVWPWLIGPYARAMKRLGAPAHDIRTALSPLVESLRAGAAIGQIPEVYDAETSERDPRRADGCMAQAWSVAELLNAYLDSLTA
ncbi:MAG: glycogen debranching enzyme N-terminal domain-containing protein [Phycisphaeraceae bacterium]|nr:MAG: glycogen debranching enzyme N-terminal domain-containing protein [Phycisphaeraceae bacterium]